MRRRMIEQERAADAARLLAETEKPKRKPRPRKKRVKREHAEDTA